ncbi:MAG: hypothetical protein HW406_74 [Candidatus Brocadiaceae bacterium]|nr:hypothetical protein [Candidatus Brocadiaceae bacterium]
MRTYKFRIIVERDEDNVYIASCPALKGCYSQGATIEDAIENIRDAIKLHIEARESLGEPIPVEVFLDEVEVSV